MCELNSLFAHFYIFSFPPHNLFFYIDSIQHCVVMQIQVACFGVMLQVLFSGIQQVGNKYLKCFFFIIIIHCFHYNFCLKQHRQNWVEEINRPEETILPKANLIFQRQSSFYFRHWFTRTMILILVIIYRQTDTRLRWSHVVIKKQMCFSFGMLFRRMVNSWEWQESETRRSSKCFALWPFQVSFTVGKLLEISMQNFILI